ncbi:Transmembrane protein [Globisporangium polare]
MEQIKVIIGRDKAAAPSVTTSESLAKTCPSLSRSQRMIGFASCFCLGYLISFGSTFALIGGSANGAKFGITYSVGNIIALCGSGFLVGPTEQVKLMMKPVRRVAAIIYLAMIIVVLAVAIAAPNLGGLVLFLVFIQFVAAVWYSASYIPYGRKILTGICKKTCGGTME